MKKILSILIFCFFGVLAYAQTSCDTCARAYSESVLKPASQKNGQPITPAEHRTTMQKMDNKINAQHSAQNVQLQLKASQTQLTNTETQLRSDLATKVEVQNIASKTPLKEVTIALIPYTDLQVVPLSTFYSQFQTNGAIVDGVYEVLVTSSTNVIKRITLTGLGVDNIDGSSTQASVGNGSRLKIHFQGGAPVLHEFYHNAWLGVRDSIRYNRDMTAANTAAIATKASQSALNAEAAARVEGDLEKNIGFLQSIKNAQTTYVGSIGDSRVFRGNTDKIIRDSLCSIFGDAGIGVISMGMNPASPDILTTVSGTTLLNQTGLAAKSANGYGRQFSQNGYYEINTATAQFGKVESFDIYYPNQDNITFEIKVDGVTVSTLSTVSGTGVTKHSVTGLSLAPHTIRITQTSVGNGVLFELNLKNTQKGIRYIRMGNSGISAGLYSTFAANSNFNYLYSDIQPISFMMLRLGVNGLISSNTGSQAKELGRVADSLIAKGVKEIIILGETDSEDASAYKVDAQNYSYDTMSYARKFKFMNLKNIAYNWKKWREAGLSDDTVHENETGGKALGGYILSNIFNPPPRINYFRPTLDSVIRLSGSLNTGSRGVKFGNLDTDYSDIIFTPNTGLWKHRVGLTATYTGKYSLELDLLERLYVTKSDFRIYHLPKSNVRTDSVVMLLNGKLSVQSRDSLLGFSAKKNITALDTVLIDWEEKYVSYQKIAANGSFAFNYTNAKIGGLYHVSVVPATTVSMNFVSAKRIIYNNAEISALSISNNSVITFRVISADSAEIVSFFNPSETKTKSLTLASAGASNNIDLENAISIDVTLTGSVEADTYNLSFSNAREGARVSISFEPSLGTQGDNSINFNANFIKNDKTALGTYLMNSKMLDFVVKGGKLRATNL